MLEDITVKCGQCGYAKTTTGYREIVDYLLENNYWHCKKCNSNAMYVPHEDE